MAYSVWQDGRFKGALAVRYPAHDDCKGIAGIFIPAADYSDIAPIIQTVMKMLPHRPTLQHGVPAKSKRAGECKPLLPLSEEEARGVAPEQVFELRNDDGGVIPTEFLMLDVFKVPEGEGELPEACRKLGIVSEGWELSASFTLPHHTQYPRMTK